MVKLSPPLAPRQSEPDNDVYLVLDNFGALGRAYLETDETQANRHTVIEDLLSGQYNWPERVVVFNTSENFARDASKDIARAVAYRARQERRKLPPGTLHFLEAQLDEDEIPQIAHGRAQQVSRPPAGQ